MNYIFDTNAVSFLFDDSTGDNHVKLYDLFSKLNDADLVCVSVVTLYELEYSLSNASVDKKEQIQHMINSMLEFFTVLPLPIDGAKIFGELKQIYKKRNQKSKENIKKDNIDIMIASTAIVNSCIVISYDLIFQDISKEYKNLNIENLTNKGAV